MTDESELITVEGFPSSRARALQAAASGPIWNVPAGRNPHFVGREQMLADLAATLGAVNPSGHIQALIGPPGVGKSQIALEYALQSRDRYSLVWWLRADDESSLNNDYGKLAEALFPAARGHHPQANRDAVRRELARRKDWLLIFDGAAKPALITDCLPEKHSGRVIITTHNLNWRGIGTVFPVAPFARNESIFFLRRRSGRTHTLLSAGSLAKTLGDLPHALDQAATLIAQTGISFDDYLRRFEAHWAELLGRGRSGGPQDALAISLGLSIRELETAAPIAAEMLNLLAFFAPQGFAKSWILAGAGTLAEPLASALSDPIALDATLARLLKFSLAESRDGQIFMHKLAGNLARDRLSHDLRTEWSHRALRLMESSFHFNADEPGTWAQSAAMLPHAMSCVEHAQQTDITVAAAASLLNQAGQCLFKSGKYEAARSAFDRALEVGYRIYGDANPRLSALANNLGRVLLRLDDLAGARQQFEWALSLDEKAYGPDHPHVAEVLNNYGLCLARLHENELAGQQFERALGIYDEVAGPAHPNTASITNNLGYLKMKRGDLSGAWDMLRRTLEIAESYRGPAHPDVANILLNLGDVQRLQGDHDAARGQYVHALAIDENVYGPFHPDVARDLSHLGALLMDTGEIAAAREHFERSLAIDEAIHGLSHPLIADRLTDLGRCLKAMNDVDASVNCFTRAAKITRVQLKPISDSHGALT